MKVKRETMSGFIAQLVEHRTGIRGDQRFKSRQSPDFVRLLLSDCLNWKIYCNDHSSLALKYYMAPRLQGLEHNYFEVEKVTEFYLEVAANYFIRCFRIDKAILF